MIIMATVHTPYIAEMSDKTWEGNKVLYAEKHGYATCAKTEDFVFEPKYIGFDCSLLSVDVFEAYPEA